MVEDKVCCKGDGLLGDLRLSKVVCVWGWGWEWGVGDGGRGCEIITGDNSISIAKTCVQFCQNLLAKGTSQTVNCIIKQVLTELMSHHSGIPKQSSI